MLHYFSLTKNRCGKMVKMLDDIYRIQCIVQVNVIRVVFEIQMKKCHSILLAIQVCADHDEDKCNIRNTQKHKNYLVSLQMKRLTFKTDNFYCQLIPIQRNAYFRGWLTFRLVSVPVLPGCTESLLFQLLEVI